MMRTFLIPLLLVALLVGCGTNTSDAPDSPAKVESEETHIDIPFRSDGTLTMSRDGETYRTIAIEIADNDSTRERGLMQRDGLPEDSGMLFIFDNESEQGFWMANTRIALDLIFVRSDGSVQSISKYIQPMRTETVPSQGPAQYVLEVEAGYTDSVGLIEGDVVEWVRTLDQ
ncbi:MAG: DUF192 domain-containing protein [Bacteroidetes bacterium]|nr:DUF192 domain-containing protein [Bacteroidota bacterium]MDA1334286.1 DUF192 domain-containing protein [Bacteroidota bacterium]